MDIELLNEQHAAAIDNLLNELHTAAIDKSSPGGVERRYRWRASIAAAWPAIYAELTEARKQASRLATLEEFARRVRSASLMANAVVTTTQTVAAVEWLDAAETVVV